MSHGTTVGCWVVRVHQPGKIQHCLKPQIRSLGNCVCSFVGTCWEICSGFHGLILCRFCTGIEEFQCVALFLEQAYHPFVLPGSSKGTTCVWQDDKFAEIVFQTKLLGRSLMGFPQKSQVFEHRLAEAINRLRETLDELTVQKKGIKCLGLLEGKMKKQI